MSTKVEHGTYEQILAAHTWAVANGWIASMGYESGDQFKLIVYGRALPAAGTAMPEGLST